MTTAYPDAVAQGWLPVALSSEVRGRPLARTLMDRPLAVFRGTDGAAAVLEDRCPHRNMPLSEGRVEAGALVCPYHGWRFGTDGRCMLVPGAERPSGARATVLPSREAVGLVWTTLAAAPTAFPEPPAALADLAMDGFWWAPGPSRARLLDAVENLLDPAHPHFLHPGMVRSAGRRREVRVTVRTGPGAAEAAYEEDARAAALMPRLLEGLRTRSVGRALAPCTGQLTFDGPRGPRFVLTVLFAPEAEDRVRPYAHFATPRGRAPAVLKAAVLKALHRPVLAQDRRALAAQAEVVARFGGPRYALGPLDVLAPAIRALAEGRPLAVSERTLLMRL